MAKHETVYGVCENKCKVPVFSQEQTLQKINEKILYGTELPETLEDGTVFLLIKPQATE